MLILTENGYKPFAGVKKVYTSGFRFTFTDGGHLDASETHRFKIKDSFTQAKDVKVGDVLGDREVKSITPIHGEFYDVVCVEGNTYTAEGIEHHNCSVIVVDETAYVKTTLWNSFIDAIAPSQSALAWKKNIFLSTANGTNHFKDMCEQAQKPKCYNNLDPETPVQLEDGTLTTLEKYSREM